MLADGALQLPDGKGGLHQPGCPHRMATGDESPRRVDRTNRLPRQVQAIIHTGHKGLPAGGEFPTLSVPAQAHVLVGLDLAGGVGVVQLNKVNFLQRVSDAGVLVGFSGPHAAGAEGVDARVTEAFVPQLFVIGPGIIVHLVGEGVVAIKVLVGLVRPVGHTHGVCPAPDSGDLDQWSRNGCACLLQLGQAVFAAEDGAGCAIAHHADVQAGQRPGHHGRIAHVLDGVTIPFLSIRVVIGIDMVLD